MRLLGDKLGDMIEDVFCRSLATYGRHGAQINQTVARKLLEKCPVRIVHGKQHGVVEHAFQPSLQWLQTAKIDCPIVFVELRRREHETERERISVNQFAMRVISAPLAEATGQAFVVIVGLNRTVHCGRSAHLRQGTRSLR